MRIMIGIIFVFAAAAGLVTSYFFHRPAPMITSSLPSDVEISHVAHYPLTFVMQLKNDPHAGQKIFAEYCSVCHSPNPEIPVHAPRIGYKQDWLKFKKMSVDDLFKLATIGYGAMPARGGCFECTDQQLKQAMQYILDNTK